MRKQDVRFTALLVATTVMLLGGCRTKPMIDPGLRDDLPPSGIPRVTDVPPIPTPGTGVDGGWSDIDTVLPPVAGEGSTFTPVKDQRWDAVVVYFAFDSTAIGPAERPKLEALAQHLQAHGKYAVVIEGHCDDRGSDEYNRALGESRALAVRDYLVTLGIDMPRLETVSYGEDRPAFPEAKTEEHHQKNRRAEFIIGIRE